MLLICIVFWPDSPTEQIETWIDGREILQEQLPDPQEWRVERLVGDWTSSDGNYRLRISQDDQGSMRCEWIIFPDSRRPLRLERHADYRSGRLEFNRPLCRLDGGSVFSHAYTTESEAGDDVLVPSMSVSEFISQQAGMASQSFVLERQ